MGRIVGENKHKGTLYPVDSKAIYRIIYKVVAVLPTENIKTSVIYCVPIVGKDNEYDMFLYINGWSKIGSGSIDLSDYYTKEEVDDIVADISTLSFKIVQEKPIEDIETNIIYLIPKSGSSAGNIYEEWIYIDNKWELLGTTDVDLSNYMTLAPLNPTAAQIAAMPSGQLYGDTVNHKGTIKGGQEFYDTNYIDGKYRRTFVSDYNPPTFEVTGDIHSVFKVGDKWVYSGKYVFTTGGKSCTYTLKEIKYNSSAVNYTLTWEPESSKIVYVSNALSNTPPATSNGITNKINYSDGIMGYPAPDFAVDSRYIIMQSHDAQGIYVCSSAVFSSHRFYYTWEKMIYTALEIDTMIGNIETALSEV